MVINTHGKKAMNHRGKWEVRVHFETEGLISAKQRVDDGEMMFF